MSDTAIVSRRQRRNAWRREQGKPTWAQSIFRHPTPEPIYIAPKSTGKLSGRVAG